jgi:aldehyde:ferredoxin oxidoreductase
MLEYLKKPSMEKTIMPKQFFMKFSQKEPSNLDEKELLKAIEEYLEFYDIKKRLEVPTP